MTLLVVENKMFVSAISSKGNGCDTKAREHGSKVGGLGENRVLAPGFTSGPRIVIDGLLHLCFDVRFGHFLTVEWGDKYVFLAFWQTKFDIKKKSP